MPRVDANDLINKAISGQIDWEDLARECLQYMTEDDIVKMSNDNDWIDDDDDYDYDDEDIDENY